MPEGLPTGTDIPMGVQAFLNYFKDSDNKSKNIYDVIKSPVGSQLLIKQAQDDRWGDRSQIDPPNCNDAPGNPACRVDPAKCPLENNCPV